MHKLKSVHCHATAQGQALGSLLSMCGLYRLVVIERARVRQLAWGNSQHAAQVLSLSPGGFDLVIGADVVYVEEAMPALFQTIATLLADKPKVSLLCHVWHHYYGFSRILQHHIFAVGGNTRDPANKLKPGMKLWHDSAQLPTLSA
jgi:hypothetical protein